MIHKLMKKCLHALTPNQTSPRIFKVFQLSAADQGQQLFNMPPASPQKMQSSLGHTIPTKQCHVISHQLSAQPVVQLHQSSRRPLALEIEAKHINHYIVYMIDWVWFSHTLNDIYHKRFMPAVSFAIFWSHLVFLPTHFWGQVLRKVT